MNKKVIIIIVVVLLLLGGFFFMRSRSGGSPLTGGPATSNTSKPGSLKDLISKGVAQTCTFSSEGSSGTVYVSGSKVRGDFDSTVEGKTTKSHMIVDKNTSYLWMEGEKNGFKMSFDPNAGSTTTDSKQTATTGALDAGADMNYNCKTWVVDGSLFTLPAGVTFTEFAIPSVAPAGSSGTTTGTSQCSYCSALTGDDKTQCLKAFNCN